MLSGSKVEPAYRTETLTFSLNTDLLLRPKSVNAMVWQAIKINESKLK